MEPVKLINATRTIGKPLDWDEEVDRECLALSVHDSAWNNPEATSNIMTSAWKPDEDELAILNTGGHVFLGIYGVKHPVVQVYAA